MRQMIFRLLVVVAAAAAPASLSAQTWDVLMKKGDQAAARRDDAAALDSYLAAARTGAPVAMNAAAQIYLVRKDYRRAFLWCSVAGKSNLHATEFGCLMESEPKLKPGEVQTLKKLAQQCVASNYKSCEQLDPSQQANIKAYEASKCRVSDPTGTQLNVRTTPSGKVIQSVENGRSVNILDTARDGQGREWSYLENNESRIALGWAISRFLTCGR